MPIAAHVTEHAGLRFGVGPLPHASALYGATLACHGVAAPPDRTSDGGRAATSRVRAADAARPRDDGEPPA